MNNETKNRTLIMVQCAVFLAMSFVIRLVEQSFPITLGGVQFMKLGLTAPFTLAPAILFGPTYGLIIGALSDLLNLFTPNSGGAFIPWLTVTAALRGWMVGMIWAWIKDRSPNKVRNGMISIFSAVGILGFVNSLLIQLAPNTAYGQLITELNSREKSIPHILTYGLIICSFIVLLLIWSAMRLEKGQNLYGENNNVNSLFLLLVAIIVPSLLQTTLNTFILRAVFAQHAQIGFLVYYIPRVAKTLIVGVITVLIIQDVLLLLYRKMYPAMYRTSMNIKDSL